MLTHKMMLCGGLTVLTGCGPTLYQTVAAAPLPETESCVTTALLSRGASLAFNRSPSGKAVTIVWPHGRWVESETRPTETASIFRPLYRTLDETGPIVVVNPDQRRAVRTIAGPYATFWLAEDSTGSTSIRTKSPNLGTYRAIAERCAAAPETSSADG